jgi:hypothetical protein
MTPATYDGVRMTTRTGRLGEYKKKFEFILDSIDYWYYVPASTLVRSLYADDKNSHFYEIAIVDEMPHDFAIAFSEWLRGLMRMCDGYNGLTVKWRGVRILEDGPWWDELEEDGLLENAPTATVIPFPRMMPKTDGS